MKYLLISLVAAGLMGGIATADIKSQTQDNPKISKQDDPKKEEFLYHLNKAKKLCKDYCGDCTHIFGCTN